MERLWVPDLITFKPVGWGRCSLTDYAQLWTSCVSCLPCGVLKRRRRRFQTLHLPGLTVSSEDRSVAPSMPLLLALTMLSCEGDVAQVCVEEIR